MRQPRRSFGGIERRGTVLRARNHVPDGDRHEGPHLFAARVDAEYWLADVHREIASGNWRPPHKDSAKGSELDLLSGFARRCLAERDLTLRTREEYNKLLEGLILPTLGKVQLRHLESDRIRRWYSTVLSDDRPTQRKHAYALLRSILREAEDEGLIERNPCRIRNAGRVRRTRDIEPASPAELNRLLDLPPRQGLPVLLAGWCGLRAGEVRGLRRRDLDLAEGVVHVRQAVTRPKGEIHVGPPKTVAGIRDVGIPPHLLPHVAKYVTSLSVTGRAGYLFPGRDGVSPMSEKALRYAYEQARKITGRDDLTFSEWRPGSSVRQDRGGSCAAGAVSTRADRKRSLYVDDSGMEVTQPRTTGRVSSGGVALQRGHASDTAELLSP